MTADADWARIARYLAGECTAQEADEIRAWINDDPERRRLVDEARSVWEAAPQPAAAWDTAAAWRRLSARLRSRERRLSLGATLGQWPPPPQQTSFSSRARWTGVAAAGAAAAAIGVLWFGGVLDQPAGPLATPPPREVRAPLGQRVQFQLSDGTRVLLAPGSLLRYDTTSFGRSSRQLQLDGRAHFIVVHDPRRPFVVQTSRTVTQDLGTEFVVTDYSSDPASEIVVASGTVAVRSMAADTTRPATVLKGGELAHLDTAGHTTVRRGIDLRLQLAWTEGRLVFSDTPVADVISTLNRWYGSEVRLGSRRLAAHRFTGSYFAESPATVLRELATAIGARLERRADTTLLVPLSVRSREK